MASSKSKFLIFAIFMALTFSSLEVSLAARLLQQSLPTNPDDVDSLFTYQYPPSVRRIFDALLNLLV
ncbi:hypothetical protein COLO4_32363 [Corchorus olitorius]|uniref:Uncharacterized protein n=1 Tax=Corchorus olitorius TaxID=93759 RepID=A0A1R3GZW4_9ROSI|nr:hypothetical protein COLO4_32363 [Corchorus olitorius]